MVVIRRRLIFWLIKAYIKKSGKIILLSFLLGLGIFLMLLFGSRYFSFIKFHAPIEKKIAIGVVGAYTQDSLPPLVMSKLSHGLTSVEKDGSIKPDVASSWEEKDNGKTYVFHIKPDKYFTNGEKVTSESISYNFSDVSIEKPDKQTIIFKLKDAYAPFLITVSKPIFKKGFTGISDYEIADIKLNGNFVQSLTLASTKNRFETIRYQFYPSEDAVKMAYLLGEISEAGGLNNPYYKSKSFATFSNTNVNQSLDYSRLVTLFYNTSDSVLSDKKVRLALTYALPETYPAGKITYMPYYPEFIYYNHDIPTRKQDFAHGKELLDGANTASGSAKVATTLTIKTLKKYRHTADAVAQTWKQIGIKTKIEEVERIPSTFQVYLGEFNVPKDPDQYVLWHSSQVNNITKYKNLRIDKLLEDGRKTADVNARKKTYADFQKYLMEDAPASFLYFPYEYTLVRK